ncbi:MAG: TadE/TadG family type IV pilus assembly protein [Pirellulaceae bacterium]|nr:TadE/TadG family type IV pilus assembly protein [Pirellulaceae bacterium]
MKSRNWKTQVQSRAGTTAVEFAFMVPIIFTMFMGAIEITRLNFIRNTASNACYEGARRAVSPGATTSEAETEARRLLNLVNAGNGATVNVTSAPDSITVAVTVPVNQNSWGISRFSSGLNVTQSCKLSRESFSQ